MNQNLSPYKLEELFDVEFLKKNALEIHAFGLGFIQIKLSPHHRLHIYCPEVKITTTDEEVHDHRYSFLSHVLKGKLEHSSYALVEGETHLLTYESCKKDIKIETPLTLTGLKLLESFTLSQGSSYFLHKDTLHQVKAEHTVTFLIRETPSKDLARVIFKKEKQPTCPFSSDLDKELLWKIVERELK